MDKKTIVAICTAIIEIIDETSSSSSEEEEELLSLSFPKVRIRNYINNVVPEYSNADFRTHFRMSREVFTSLLTLIECKLRRKSKRYGRHTISAEKQLLIALWTMATPDSYRSVCDRFNVARATAWYAVRRVCQAIYSLAPQIIKWPNREEAEYTWINIENNYKFPKVVGAIDGTHIPISKPKKDSESYINRKGYHSIQLQVVCDSTLKFIHCYAGQPGCVHDMRVFRLSGIQEMCTADHFPEDSHILGDGAYALQKHVMVPYKNNGHLTEAQLNFNYRLSSSRTIVERAIGLLKGRFRSLLDNLPMTRTDLIPRYIIVCCVLHNICISHGDFIDDLMETEINTHTNIDPNIEPTNEETQCGIEKRRTLTYMLQHTC